MNRNYFSRSQFAILFIVGICAIVLGTAVRYYTAQSFVSKNTTLKQTASIELQRAAETEDSTTEDNSQENGASQIPVSPIAGNSSQANGGTPNIQNEIATTRLPTEDNTEGGPPSTPQEAGTPNLTVVGMVVDPLPMNKNAPVRITATVRNTGTGQAVSVSGALSNSTNSYSLGTHAGYTFAPGQQYEFWEQNSYPYFAVCTNGGVNMLRFTIDPLNQIQESNENDNTFEIAAALVGC